MVASSTYLVVERGESRDEEALENVFVIPIDRHFGDSTADCQQRVRYVHVSSSTLGKTCNGSFV